MALVSASRNTLAGIANQSDKSSTGAGGLRAVFLAGFFVAAVGLLVQLFLFDSAMAGFVVISAMVGGYMALNIGANDVANNVGPAV